MSMFNLRVLIVYLWTASRRQFWKTYRRVANYRWLCRSGSLWVMEFVIYRDGMHPCWGMYIWAPRCFFCVPNPSIGNYDLLGAQAWFWRKRGFDHNIEKERSLVTCPPTDMDISRVACESNKHPRSTFLLSQPGMICVRKEAIPNLSLSIS